MIADGATVIDERVSPRGSVSCWVVLATGRRVTVQLPRGADTPEGIAEVAAAVVELRFKPRGST